MVARFPFRVILNTEPDRRKPIADQLLPVLPT